jgi:hypothetical protein
MVNLDKRKIDPKVARWQKTQGILLVHTSFGNG